jgi:hypothetical protein
MKSNAIKSHEVILASNGLVHHTANTFAWLMFINKMLHIKEKKYEGTLSNSG